MAFVGNPAAKTCWTQPIFLAFYQSYIPYISYLSYSYISYLFIKVTYLTLMTSWVVSESSCRPNLMTNVLVDMKVMWLYNDDVKSFLGISLNWINAFWVFVLFTFADVRLKALLSKSGDLTVISSSVPFKLVWPYLVSFTSFVVKIWLP